MEYTYIKLIISVIAGFGLIIFRKQIADFQKSKSENKNGVIDKKLKDLPASHLESVSIFGGIICFAVAILSVIELLN